MKKSIFCLILAICLCLCVFLVSCKPDEPDVTPDQSGQIHTTPDASAGVAYGIDIPPVGNDTKPY